MANNPHSGSFILNHLQKWGSDVSVKHEFTFWIYFPTKAQCRRGAQRARACGLGADINRSASGKDWLCLISCPHIPDEAILDGVIDFCVQLAAAEGGTFDGWESPLLP